MNEKEIEKLVKQAIIDYHIDTSIQATRVVGNKLEIYLYGGQVIRVPVAAREQPALPARPAANNNGSLKAKIKKITRRGGA